MARTPSREAHEKVLQAALRLIAERGVEASSMDAIAAASGVSKATVYKHWDNKDALLLDVIRNHSDQLPDFDSGNPQKDLVQLVRHLAEGRKRAELGPVWPKIIGYAAANQDFARAMQQFAFEPRRAQIKRIIEQAVSRGELRRGIDTELAMDLLVGPIMHRRFVGGTVPPDMPGRIVDYFWEVFKRRPTPVSVPPPASGSRTSSHS